MYTDEMYHAATKILQNREDQLIHSIDNTDLLKKKDRMLQQSRWEYNKRNKKYDPKTGIAYTRKDRYETDAEIGKHGYSEDKVEAKKFFQILDKAITDEQIQSMFKNGADRKEIAEIIYDRLYKEYGYNPANLPWRTEYWIDEKITKAIKK